jgi:putative ABC transport system permease protein
MKILDLRLLRTIKESKGQYIAILVVLTIGILIYTSLNISSINLKDSLYTYYDTGNFADYFIELMNTDETVINNIMALEQVSQANGRHVLEAPLITNDENERVTVRVISLPENEDRINNLELIEGRLPLKGSAEVAVLEQLAVARNINIGDSLIFQAHGQQIELAVVSLVASPEFVYLIESEQTFMPNPENYGVVYLDEGFMSRQYGLGSNYNNIVLTLEDNYKNHDMKKLLEDVLKYTGVMRITERSEQISNRMVHEEINGLEKASNSIPLIFLAVAAIILGVMLKRIVENDRIAIGILKSMGYSNKEVLFHYMKYAISIGIIGGIIGLIIGYALSGMMTSMYVDFFNIPLLTVNIYYEYIALSMILSVIFCVLAGLYGAIKIIKIHPAESMRPQAPMVGKRTILEKLPKFWSSLSFSWKNVLRNILRSKSRVIFIILGISLTYAVLLFSVYINDVFDEMFNLHFGEFMSMEYEINFSQPLNMNQIDYFEELADIDLIEPKNEFPFEFIKGRENYVINIIGLEENTNVYNFRDLSYMQMKVPSTGIIVSENLARKFDLQLGDYIEVSSFIPERDNVLLEVKGVTKQLFGINAYMNIEFMNEVLLDGEMMTGIYVNSKDNIVSKFKHLPVVSSILSNQELREVFEEFTGLIILSIGMMVVFGGILGFVIIYTATNMSISERIMEFSSLRVMGFRKKEIFALIKKENYVLTVLGILLGIPLGKAFIQSLDIMFSNELYTLSINASIMSYILAAFLTILFIYIAQFATRRRIEKLEFLEALKNRMV